MALFRTGTIQKVQRSVSRLIGTAYANGTIPSGGMTGHFDMTAANGWLVPQTGLPSGANGNVYVSGIYYNDGSRIALNNDGIEINESDERENSENGESINTNDIESTESYNNGESEKAGV